MFEAFAGFLFDVVFFYLFYWPGWLILRIFTLGKYPPALPEKHNQLLGSVHNQASQMRAHAR